MTERSGIHKNGRMASIMRGITTLQEEEIHHDDIRLHSPDNLQATLIYIHVFLLIPPPDILNQRLEAQHGTFCPGRVESTTFACTQEHICIRWSADGMEVDARTKGVIVARSVIVEEFIDTVLQGWKGGDVDVNVVPEKEFVGKGQDNVCLAMLAIGQEKNLLHLGCRLEYRIGIGLEW